MKSFDEINALIDGIETKLKEQKKMNITSTSLREDNLKKIAELFKTLELFKKHPDFSTLFNYTAMNLAGIGLKDEDFAEIRKGKYVQIISIAYEVDNEGIRINKNTSLGYYGKAEKLTEKEKTNIIEFVLRWRYEKSFQHSDDYQRLLETIT